MKLKKMQKIALSDYLLEIERVKSGGILNYGDTGDYARFRYGICRYFKEVFNVNFYDKMPKWVEKYCTKTSVSWGNNPIYLANEDDREGVIKALQIRVDNLLKELEEA